MPPDLASIRAKLTDAELAFLKQAHGIELRDPEVFSAMSQMDEARAQILKLQERMLRSDRARNGEPAHCSFCDGSVHAVGPLAQSTFGPLICHACAVACVSATRSSEHDA